MPTPSKPTTLTLTWAAIAPMLCRFSGVAALSVGSAESYQLVSNSVVRLAPRLERAAALMNPFLLTIAIGLIVLNVTCFIALQVSPPKPDGRDIA
jgi:hypothetical protein